LGAFLPGELAWEIALRLATGRPAAGRRITAQSRHFRRRCSGPVAGGAEVGAKVGTLQCPFDALIASKLGAFGSWFFPGAAKIISSWRPD